jgi:hypothetical protein
MPFWRMIKEGNDHFEVTKAEPHVDVCEKRYVFDARAPGYASPPPVFHPREKCPSYEVPEAIASAVRAKEASDERAVAENVNRGVATVAVKTGADGGMHAAFLAKLQGRGALYDLQSIGSSSAVKAPSGPLPSNVNPPHASEPESTMAFAAPAQSAQPGQSTSAMGTIGRWLGFGGSEATAASAATPVAATPAPRAKSAPSQPAKSAVGTAPASKPRPQAETTQVVHHVPPPSAPHEHAPVHAAWPETASPQPAASAAPPAVDTTAAGAGAPVPTGSFEGRWGAAVR